MSSYGGADVTQNNETHINGKSYIFTWVVKNFKLNLGFGTGCKITSPSFQTDYGLCNLDLYPSGIYGRSREFLSIAPHVLNNEIDYIHGNSIISLVNKSGKKVFHSSDFLRTEDMKVIEQFVRRCDITSDFLPNGDLTIKWKLYFYVAAEPFENSPIQSMENLAETRRLAVLDDFEKLQKDNRFSDFKIVVDNQTFFAHKIILAARSRYFAAMFESNTKEVNEREIRVSNVSANIMQEILRFIYTGKINIEQTSILDLLIVADMYQLDDLMTMGNEVFISNMNVENIGSILTDIDRLKEKFKDSAIDQLTIVEKFKDSAIEFLRKNAKELSGNESFRNVLNSLSHLCVVDILNIVMSKT